MITIEVLAVLLIGGSAMAYTIRRRLRAEQRVTPTPEQAHLPADADTGTTDTPIGTAQRH